MAEAQGEADRAMPSTLRREGETRQWPTEMTMADLDLKRRLDSGAFGAVHLVSCKNDRLPAEQAVIKISTTYEDDVSLQREVDKMRRIRHQSIIEVYSVVKNGFGEVCGILMEYAELGSVYRVVEKLGEKLPWALQLRILSQTASGVLYLHQHKMLHRDLKSPNILLKRDCQVKICDFGMSKVRAATATVKQQRRQATDNKKEGGGTTRFMAPELLENFDAEPSRKQDVYAFAITMWEVLTGKWPYSNMWDDKIIIDHVLRRNLRPNCNDIPRNSDAEKEIVGLMQRCWTHDPDNRPYFDHISSVLQRLAGEVAMQAYRDAESVLERLPPPMGEEGRGPAMPAQEAGVAAQEPRQGYGEARYVNAIESQPDSLLIRKLYGGMGEGETTGTKPPSSRQSTVPIREGMGRMCLTENDRPGSGQRHTQQSQQPHTGHAQPSTLYINDELSQATEEDLNALAPRIAHRWTEFALHLRLTPWDLAKIAEQYARISAHTTTSMESGLSATPVQQVRAGLYVWRDRFKDQAIRKWLLAACVHMGMMDVTPVLNHPLTPVLNRPGTDDRTPH